VQTTEDDCRLFVIRGEGGGCTLEATGMAAAAWIPLRGELQVHSPGMSIAVRGKWVLVTGQEAMVRVTAYTGSKWLALMGSGAACRLLMAGVPPPRTRLLPAMHAIDRSLRRKIVALARCVVPGGLEDMLEALAGEVATLQAPLYQAVARGPGRTFAAKLQVFLRLQRVRRFMTAYCEQELDNAVLARVANYSPCHFLRTFRAVYLETPHAYLVRQRLRRAEQLLHSGDLAVTEVALASGFENRSAFSRRYRQHFGITAREARHRGAQPGLRAAAE
jgi:AraC family transcriptional regulator